VITDIYKVLPTILTENQIEALLYLAMLLPFEFAGTTSLLKDKDFLIAAKNGDFV
jgi:hypothetical protein